MAGPERPPKVPRKIGRRVSISMAMPRRVFISEMASAPASSTARAMAAMSVTLGDNLTMSGSWECCLTKVVTLDAAMVHAPKAMPPVLTFGQEMLTSSALTPATLSRRAASAAYSSSVLPLMFTITGACCWRRKGISPEINFSTPGFSRPMELISPAGVSMRRVPGLPVRGARVMPLTTMAPSIPRSKNWLSSLA